MFTGKSSGKLGIFDFFEIGEDYNAKGLDLTEIYKGGFLWDLVDVETGVVSVPMIDEYDIDGFMVGDWVKGGFAGKKIDTGDIEPLDSLTPSGKLETARKNFDVEMEKVEEIMEDEEGLLVTVHQLTDRVIHFGTEGKFEAVYGHVDKKLGGIVDRCEEEGWNLLIVSDHGGKKIEERFNLNTWLKENGYLELEGGFSWETRVASFLSRYSTNFVRSCMEAVKKLHRMFRGKEKDTARGMATENIDFKNTKAFTLSTLLGDTMGIWINTEGRFSEGNVDEEEKEDLVEEIKEKLEKERAVKEVWRREEKLNVGELNFNLPDLVVKAEGGFLMGYRPMPKVYSKRNRFTHDQYGTIMGFGPDFDRVGEVEGIEIKDVTPTLLHMFGEDVPEDMDGEVRKEMLSEEHKGRDVSYRKGTGPGKIRRMDEEEETEMKERLSKLGYMD